MDNEKAWFQKKKKNYKPCHLFVFSRMAPMATYFVMIFTNI